MCLEMWLCRWGLASGRVLINRELGNPIPLYPPSQGEGGMGRKRGYAPLKHPKLKGGVGVPLKHPQLEGRADASLKHP